MANTALAKLGYNMLEYMYTEHTGERATTITNLSDYIGTYTKLQQALNPDQFMGIMGKAISKIIFKSTGDVKDDYSFIQTSAERFGEYMARQRVFARAIDEGDGRFDYSNGGEAELLKDDYSADQYKVKNSITETRIVGGTIVFSDHKSTFYDQLDQMFENPAKLGEWVNATMTEFKKNYKRWKLSGKRGLFIDYLLSLYVDGTKYPEHMRKIKLISEYNEKFGYTSTDIHFVTFDNWYKHGYIEDFLPWCFIRIPEVLGQMASYNKKFMSPMKREFQGNDYEYYCEGQGIKSVFIEEFLTYGRTFVEAFTLHPEKFVGHDYATVKAWVDIFNKYDIRVDGNSKVDLPLEDGTLESVSVSGQLPLGATKINTIVGVAYEDSAVQFVTKNEWEKTTDLNANGGYYVTWIHSTVQPVKDMNDKGCVFVLE